ncbi:methionyl-tRNA formyltransferase, mitochondrial isoform X1 [Poeciliopsis prolifica]|uniref:methionyl-tRNA formyltransferase, mitochondrial isoform X1 n=1 Tax=Poeciliopsis prolifica TaxID=188132 RepID=UPI002413FD71|nr:methionyl-tRNA formyltransferase, mitochondrial isoform X1 [Poeciliopsis prolifica]
MFCRKKDRFTMWMNRKTDRVFLKTLSYVLNVLKFSPSTNVRTQSSRKLGPSRLSWRLLFFGSDQFAVESLKLLNLSRNSNEGIVEKLEVVTLPGDLPVKRFAQQNQLALHSWPPHNVEGQFDVGVVVSFGRLLHHGLIDKFPFGILNVHPSLLPRWRGPAPVFHTVMHGDTVTGVTIIQILPNKFDVGPILNQEIHQIPKNCTAEDLGAALATKGAHLLLDTLMKLPEKIANKREQELKGVTFAPKINTSMSWINWEEQTCDQIACLSRAIGSQIPLRTMWMGKTIKLLDFVGKFYSSDDRNQKPGSVYYDKDSNTLAVCCKDGWVAFRTVLLNKRLTAADFHNGYLNQTVKKDTSSKTVEGQFVSRKGRTEELQTKSWRGQNNQ